VARDGRIARLAQVNTAKGEAQDEADEEEAKEGVVVVKRKLDMLTITH